MKEGSGSFSGWQFYGSFSKGKRSHTFTGLTNGTAYTYKMRAFETGIGLSNELTANAVTPGSDGITQVAITSTPKSDPASGSGKVYGAGEKIQVTVTFVKAATVTGDPEFEIKLGNSGVSVAKRALYMTGSGTTELVFEYTVLPTDVDNNGIWIEANALKLDSDDMIQDGDSNTLTVTHVAPGGQSSHKVDGSRTPPGSNTAPTASNNTVETKEDTAYTFAASDFNFSDTDMDDALEKVKIVTVETAGDLELDGTDVTANQEVTKANLDDDKLIFTPATDANGASYATFTFKVNDGDDDSANTYTMTINVQSAPDVTQVAVTSTPQSGTTPKKYGAGEDILVTVTLDEAVAVLGDPVINLQIGSNSRPATYVSGTGTKELLFGYTVVAADTDSNGISINANALTLPVGAGIEGISNPADITHAALATQSDHKVDGSLTPPAGAICTGEHPAGIWEACLTVGKDDTFSTYGFTSNIGALSDATFTYKRWNFEVTKVEYLPGGSGLNFTVKSVPSLLPNYQNMVLQIGDESHNLVGTGSVFIWNPPGFAWEDANIGDKVLVSLRLGPGANQTPPRLRIATVDVDTVAMTFDETLLSHSASTPTSAFTIKVNGTAVPLGSTLDGSVIHDNDKTVSVKLENPVSESDTVTVSYALPRIDEYLLSDLDGNYVQAFTDQPVRNDTYEEACLGRIGRQAPWAACLSGGQDGGSPAYAGFKEGQYGRMTSKTFTVEGTTYTIDVLHGELNGQPVELSFTSDPSALNDWILRLNDSEDFHLSRRSSYDPTTYTYRWDNSHIWWDSSNYQDTLDVSLRPPDPGCEADARHIKNDIWTACLTIKGEGNAFGYNGNVGTLTKRSFSDGIFFTIDALYRDTNQDRLVLSFTEDPRPISQHWDLQVIDRTFRLIDADRFDESTFSYIWDNSGIGWSATEVDEQHSVSLRRHRLPPNNEIVFEEDPPSGQIERCDEGPVGPIDPGDNCEGNRFHGLVVGEQLETSYRVKLKNDPGDNVTVRLVARDEGAISVTPGTIEFTPKDYDRFRVVTVVGLNDADGLDEHTSVGHEGGGLTSPSFSITVKDDDEHVQSGDGLITNASGFRVRVAQGGTAKTFTVRPRFQPEQKMTMVWDPLVVEADMPVRPGNASNTSIKIITDKVRNRGVTIRPREMTFTSSNWNTAQTFTVQADSGTDGAEIDLRPWWPRKEYPYLATPEIRVSVLLNLSTAVPEPPRMGVLPGNGRVRVTWTPAENSESITSWQYRYGELTGEGVGWNAWETVPGGQPDASSHTIDGLTNGTSYGVQMRGMVGNLETSATNTHLAMPQATLTLDAPARPMLDTRSGNGQVELSWEAPDFGGTITAWQYRYGQVQLDATVDWGDWTAIAGGTANTDAYSVTGLENETKYGFQLRAVAGEHVGDMSEVEIGWPWHPTFARFEVTDVGANSVSVEWDLPQDVVGTGLRAEYRVPEGEWQSTDLALDATTHEFIGLEPATLYNFRIVFDSDTGGTDTGPLIQQTAEDTGWGAVTGFMLVDASDDTDLGAIENGAAVQGSADGTYGMRAEVAPAAGVQSVVMTLEGDAAHTQTENILPYSLYGDADGAEHGRTLAAGSYTLSATAYATKGGQGEVLGTRTVSFTVENAGAPAAPAVTSFTLVDAATQAVLATLTGDSNTVDLADPDGGSYALRANLAPNITAGSVVLSLSGTKTVSQTESMAPYSLWGDSPNNEGGRDLDGASLPAGSYTLAANVYSQSGGRGSQLGAGATVSFTVRQLIQLSVGDSSAVEGENDHLPFNVYLDHESTETVTVNYTTVDGTATAGSDYTATSGTLTFQPGETRKTVLVPVLDDDIDEGSETMTLRLSSPSNAVISDAEGTGTITNSDPLQRAWLARFGRTVGTHVTDAVGERLRGAPGQASHLTIGGYRLPLGRQAGTPPGRPERSSTSLSLRSERTGEQSVHPERRPLEAGVEGSVRRNAPEVEGGAKSKGPGEGGEAERALAAKLWGPLSTDAAAAPPGRLAAVLTEVARVLGVGSAGPGSAPTDSPWLNQPGQDPRLGRSMTPTFNPDLRQVLLGSSFRLNLGATDAGAGTPRLTAWGRFAGTTFAGQDGDLALDGDVFTGTVGVDSEWDRLLAGVAVAHSRGDGSFNNSTPGMADRGRGGLAQTLTSLHPYVRYAVTDRLDVWGLVGYGWGELDLELATGVTLETDTTLVMGAFGGRGLVLAPEDAGGFQLATRTDAMLTRTSSDAVTGRTGNLAAADADAHRVRVILEGSRGVTWDGGQSLTPTVEVGLRHDWGDAETGFGVEVGGRVQYADPGLGLTVEGAVRGLLAHEDSDYEEWGASGTVRLAPGAGGQGLSLTLAPTWGAVASGVEGLWSRQTTQGLAPQGLRPTQTGRLQAEVGYGLPAPLGTGLLTPYAGTVLTEGADRTYRVGTRWAGVTGLQVNLEGTRQESAAGQQPVNQGVRLQVEWGF